MIHLNPSKTRDFAGTAGGNFDFSVNRPAQPVAFAKPYNPSVNPLDGSISTDGLRWDEYGNPYVVSH